MEAIKYLQVEPTTRCNFRCRFCSGRYLEQRDIACQDFVYLIDHISGIEHLNLQGEGEPFLHPDFFAMVNYAKQKAIQVSTISNGSFLLEKIEDIFQSEIDAMRISIESPLEADFKFLRGGNLNTVLKGLETLIQERNKRELVRPVVGFATTMLRDQVDLFPQLIELYDRLEMDGGIEVQFLNSQAEYVQHYDAYLKTQILSSEEQLEFWRQYAPVLRKLRQNRSILHFFDTFLPRQYEQYQHQDCPWLKAGLYVDGGGFATGCGCIKNASLYAFGRINQDSLSGILDKRKKMRAGLLQGMIPECCKGCGIAESIVSEPIAVI
jgi:MoaA/NifB/PqqE/SkfB family radical SAM enzyme